MFSLLYDVDTPERTQNPLESWLGPQKEAFQSLHWWSLSIFRACQEGVACVSLIFHLWKKDYRDLSPTWLWDLQAKDWGLSLSWRHS